MIRYKPPINAAPETQTYLLLRQPHELFSHIVLQYPCSSTLLRLTFKLTECPLIDLLGYHPVLLVEYPLSNFDEAHEPHGEGATQDQKVLFEPQFDHAFGGQVLLWAVEVEGLDAASSWNQIVFLLAAILAKPD